MTRLADWAAPVVAFVLYTNASVVAVEFHGVPFVVAASYVLLLLLPIVRDVVFRGEPLNLPPALPYVLALLAVVTFGALFAALPDVSIGGLQEFVLEGVLIYVLVALAIRTPRSLRLVIWSLIAAGAFMGALVVYQQFTESFDTNFGGFAQVDLGKGFVLDEFAGADAERQKRLGGSLGFPNRFAQMMAVLVPIALFQFRASSRRSAKLLALSALVLIVLGFSLPFSRGAAVGLAFMGIVMIAMGYVSLRQVAALVAALALLIALVPQYGKRLSSLVDVAAAATTGGDGGVGVANVDGNTRGRITEMVTAVLIFADHPLIGVGPRMYREHYIEYARVAGGRVRQGPRQAHSLPLHIGAEHGLLGLVALGMVLIVTFRGLERARRRWMEVDPAMALLTAGLMLGLVAYLGCGLFLHLTFIRYFWFLLAVAGAAGCLAPSEERAMLGWLVHAVQSRRAVSPPMSS